MSCIRNSFDKTPVSMYHFHYSWHQSAIINQAILYRGGGSTVSSKKRLALIFAVTLSLLLPLTGCKLQYHGEDFSLKISPNGGGNLSVTYKNFGSGQEKSYLRTDDLDKLRDAFRNDEYIKKAANEKVKVISRRLDFVDYTLNAHIVVKAGDYKNFFKLFTNYSFEIDDKMYITPKNGVVSRATLSDGGEIVVRGNKYSFAWPLGTRDLSFKASYKVVGTSFKNEFRKQYQNKQ